MPVGSESERRHHKYDFSVLQQKFRNKLLYILDFKKHGELLIPHVTNVCENT